MVAETSPATASADEPTRLAVACATRVPVAPSRTRWPEVIWAAAITRDESARHLSEHLILASSPVHVEKFPSPHLTVWEACAVRIPSLAADSVAWESILRRSL